MGVLGNDRHSSIETLKLGTAIGAHTNKQIYHTMLKRKFHIHIRERHTPQHTPTHVRTCSYRQPWQTIAEGLGGKQCYWCCCGKSGNFIGCVPQSPCRHRNVRSKIHLCPAAGVHMWHVQNILQACVRKELPAERRNDHSSERWKYLDVKATISSLLFPHLCCRNFRLDLNSGELQSVQTSL